MSEFSGLHRFTRAEDSMEFSQAHDVWEETSEGEQFIARVVDYDWAAWLLASLTVCFGPERWFSFRRASGPAAPPVAAQE